MFGQTAQRALPDLVSNSVGTVTLQPFSGLPVEKTVEGGSHFFQQGRCIETRRLNQPRSLRVGGSRHAPLDNTWHKRRENTADSGWIEYHSPPFCTAKGRTPTGPARFRTAIKPLRKGRRENIPPGLFLRLPACGASRAVETGGGLPQEGSGTTTVAAFQGIHLRELNKAPAQSHSVPTPRMVRPLADAPLTPFLLPSRT